jgi:hypothetical protein
LLIEEVERERVKAMWRMTVIEIEIETETETETGDIAVVEENAVLLDNEREKEFLQRREHRVVRQLVLPLVIVKRETERERMPDSLVLRLRCQDLRL